MSLDFIDLVHLECLSCLILTNFEDLDSTWLVRLTNTSKECFSIMSHAKLAHDSTSLIWFIALVNVEDVSITTTTVSLEVSARHVDNTCHLHTSSAGPLKDPIVTILHVDEVPHVNFTAMTC